jgi:hypothetical protein
VSVAFTIVATIGPPWAVQEELHHVFRVLAFAALFMACIAWLLVHVPWLRPLSARREGNRAVVILVVGALGAGLAIVLYLLTKPADSAVNPTAIFVDYGLAESLPIHVPPKSTLYLVRLNPNMAGNAGFSIVQNSGNSELFWPSRDALDLAVAVTMLNRGNDTVIGIELIYGVSFRSPSVTGGSSATDPVVASFNHRVQIPALDAREAFRFVLVNDSPLYSEVQFPSVADLQVFGEDARRRVPLMRSRITPLDGLPVWSFGPKRWAQ